MGIIFDWWNSKGFGITGLIGTTEVIDSIMFVLPMMENENNVGDSEIKINN